MKEFQKRKDQTVSKLLDADETWGKIMSYEALT